MKYSPVPSTIPAMDMRDQTVGEAVTPRGKRKMKRSGKRGRRKSGRQ
jgi:hypothetical protein